MHNNRSQVSPEAQSIEMSPRPSMSYQLAADQPCSLDSSNITAIVWKEVAKTRKSRRRSLENMLGNAVAHDERNKEEMVRATLRQVIVKHTDWDSYLTRNSDYVAFISNWSCHWWCWRLCSPGCRERHFLQSLDGDFLCALHYAVLHNNLHVCESLLRDKRCDVNVEGANRETVLHMYARRHKWSKPDEVDPGEQILRSFLDLTSKTKIDALDDDLGTPLHHAVKRNNYSYAKWLVDHGADVTKASRFNETPLHLACTLSSDGDCVRMIEIFLPVLFSNMVTLNQLQRRYINMQDADGKTALCRAAEKKHVETVNILLPHVDNDQWETTLVSTVKSGNCTILNIILGRYNRHSALNVPLLHLASKLNNGRRVAERPLMTTESPPPADEDYIIAYLVENLHLNVVSDYNNEGYTPVLLATHFGYVDCVKYLLSTSKNVDEQLKECTKDLKDRGLNILHLCAEQGRQDSIKNSSVQFIYDPDGQTVEMALPTTKMVHSSESGHLAICKFVFDDHKYKHIACQLLYEQDSEGNTPLHLACKQGNMHICELFVKHMTENKYLFVEDLKQRTPLHACAKFGNRALVKILLPDTVDKKTAMAALNESQDINGKTPLHIACIEGNMEVIKCFAEEFNASVITQAANHDTLLFSACEYGHLNVVNYLLEETNADATVRNSKGLNALDAAIVNHREHVVQRLLACDNWRRLMRNAYYDAGGVVSTPMRELIIFMPDIAYDVIDAKLTMVKGSDDIIEHQVIYDYTFFEDQYHIRDWMYGEDHRKKCSGTNWLMELSCSKDKTAINRSNDTYTDNVYTLVRNHPLLIIAQCEEMKLMEHEYCTRLRTEKFRRFGLILFPIFFINYALFVALYTLTVLKSKHPFFYYDLYNQSVNGTVIWDYGHDASICQQVGSFLISSNITNFLKNDTTRHITSVMYTLLCAFLSRNVFILLLAFPRIFRKMALYFESLALVLCFSNLYDWYSWQQPLNMRCPVQWQLGSVGLLFSWITLLTYMRYIPWMSCGLNVVMVQVIFNKFRKCIPVLSTLICSFGFTYYMLLQYQLVYGTPFAALMRTSMSLFDLGYEVHLYTPSSGGIMLYPVIYFVFILSEIVLAIIITNLLIGLAVGEISTLKTEAQLNRNIIFYELLFDYELLHLQLKRLARCLFRCIRHGEFPFWCCRCRCSVRCSTLTRCVCCECSVSTRDYMSNSRHPRDTFFLSRWMDKFEGWLVEKEIQSAIADQKKWKKKHAAMDNSHDD